MASIIFDTNIYIYHSFAYPDAVQVWNQNLIVENHQIIISTIQISELLSYHKIDYHAELRKQREKYISLADEVVFVDNSIARKAAELRRLWKAHSGKSLKLPDALIAATAILNEAILFSNNDQDFIFLKEHHNLNYINPIQNQSDLHKYMEEQKRLAGDE